MTKVLKRKGTVEPYKPDKIKGSLQKAAIDAGYSVDEKEDIIKAVFDNINKKLDKGGEIKSDTIRACLLTELDKCEPYIAKSWRNFDKKYKSP
ncbi:MAG TPA: ATP cone domain-containing protein [Methanobacterium sp.]|nr:MAG: transcriptional regulator [Methanobacterium sp.]HOI72236.1 ATP cone domain-containing protein [Methanobacterium sp.]HPX78204.1 ATP cone domain-containing protein [Methanobacterium sp.]